MNRKGPETLVAVQVRRGLILIYQNTKNQRHACCFLLVAKKGKSYEEFL